MSRSQKELDEFKEKNKDKIQFFSCLYFFCLFIALPLIGILLLNFVSVKIGGNSGGGRCSDHMGSYDC
jgi:ABC-type Fe3+ transport system permease subunit